MKVPSGNGTLKAGNRNSGNSYRMSGTGSNCLSSGTDRTTEYMTLNRCGDESSDSTSDLPQVRTNHQMFFIRYILLEINTRLLRILKCVHFAYR